MKKQPYLSTRSFGKVLGSFLLVLFFWAVSLFGSEQVTQVGGLIVPRKDHTATVLADGRVLILGGQTAAGELASAEIFDPVARTFSAAGSMSVPRVRHAATRLANGKVLITGGRNSSGALATAEIYDPAASAAPFRTLSSAMGTARQYHTSTLLANGKVLLAGGDLTGTGELYNPATETFSLSLIAMIESRSGQTATTMPENSVLLAGGGRRSVEVFDLQSSAFLSWSAMMNESRTRASAITAADGSIYFVGGEPVGTLEKFNLLSGSGASFPLGAASSAATQLANGKILVTGPALASLFTPSTGTLTPIANSTPLQRSGQTATELPGDKQILFVGGSDATMAYIALGALYNPARVDTDKLDYYPDEPVIVYGFGWKPSENVDLYVVDNMGWVFDSTVTADANGQFTADPYFVVLWRHLGVTFDLRAVGTQSGLQAKHTFTDTGKVASVTVGAQTGSLTQGTADSATYSVKVKVTKLNGTVNLSVLTSPALPAGVTASFSPSSLTFHNIDDEELTSTLTLTTTAGALGGTYAFKVRGQNSTNDVAEGDGSLLIKKVLTITGAVANNKVYNGNTAATVNFGAATLVGVAGGDIVTINSSSYVATFNNKNVGTGKAVTVSGVTLGGADAAKYALTQPTGLTANITALGISGTFSAANKIYDGTTAATASNRQLAGVISPDDVSLTGGTATFINKDAGTGKTVTLTGATLAGTDAGNYSLTSVATTTANITPLGITGSFSAANKVYDGTTAATASNLQLAGVIAPDVVSLTGGTATFDTKNVGNGKTVTLTGATLAGAQAGNYSLTSVATTTANITPLGIAGSFSAANKIYDGTTAATASNRQLAGVIAPDDVSLTGGTATFDTKDVGNGKTVTLAGATLAGAQAGNYSLTSVATTTANITPLGITGSFSAANKIYDGTTAATASNRQLTGVIAPDDVSLTGGTATFDTKNVGNGKTVTLTGATLAGAQAGNYSLTSVATTTANITPLGITGSFTAVSKTYDGTTAATVGVRSLSGVISPDDVALTGGVATFDTKHVGNGKIVTLVGATLGGAQAGNYSLTSVGNTTANITALAITGNITASSKVYDATTAATILTRTLTGVIGTDDVSYTGGSATFSDKNVGTGKTVTGTGLSLTGADAGNYTVNSTATTTADITALAITGSITANDKIYDGNSTATIATRTLAGVLSGDVVTYTGGTATFDNKNVGTGKTVSATGLSLTGADAGNYSVNSTATTTASITPRALVVSATGINKPYDGLATATVTLSDNRVAGDMLVLAYTAAAFNNENVGNAKPVSVTGITVTGADSGNYTYNTTAATTADITPIVLTITATGINKVYDGTTVATVTLSDNRLSGDDLTLSYGAAAFANKNVGTGKTVSVTGINVSGADAGNYTYATTASTTADITPKAITGSITAQSRVYNANTNATILTRTLSGAVAGDDVTYTGGTASFNNKNVGMGKLVTASGLSLAGVDAGNYTVNTTATTLADITPYAITGSITASNKIYDATTAATIVTRTLADVFAGDVVSYVGGSATFSDKNVGTGKTVTGTSLSLSGADAGNYTVNSTATTTADITPLAITGSITANDKVYDGTTAATIATRTLVGVISGDVVSYSGGTATFADKNVANGKTVTATGLSLTGADAGNYTVNSSATTTASITRRTLVVSATGINKPYDGTSAATVTLSDNRVAGDVLTVTYGLALFNNENVGTGKPVSVTSINIAGPDSINYLANTTATTTADITPIVLTITATGINKVYDGTTVATVTLSDNRLSGDDLTLSYVAAAFANKNVGTGKSVSVTGISVSGADAGNYTYATTASTTADITPKAITGSVTAQSRVYNANTNATILTRTLSGAVAGDDVTYTGGTASFNNKNVGTGKLVTATGLSLLGVDAGNYTVNTTATTLADITPYAITGSITASNKVYDATTAATILTRTLADVFAGDVVSYVGGSATFADKNVGTGKTVTGTGLALSGADAGNYTVNSTATTTADITALAITGSITANDKIYDGNSTATIATRTLAGVLSGDVVTYTGGTATFDNKNVGTGKTVSASGLSLTGVDAGNYTVNSTATTTASITPRALVVSATGINKPYDGLATATVTLSDNRVAGDMLVLTYTAAAFNNENVGNAKPVSVTGITVTGADSGNYTYNTTAATTADITPIVLTITATGINKVYDGTTVATVTLSDNRLSGDDLTLSYGAAAFANKNVGTGKAVSVTGINVSGTDAGNYTYATTASATADITPKAITGSITAQSRVYNANANATILTRTLSGAVAGDDVSYTGGTASFNNKNVGTGKLVTATSLSLSGVDAGNYTVNATATAYADITAYAIIGSITASNKVYDATTTATILTRTLADVFAGDVVSYTGGSATFSDKNVGTGKTVTGTSLSLSGADAGNYTVNSTATTTADITALAITGSITANDKVYDGTTAATIATRTLAGVLSGDVVTYSGGTATFADKNVGTGKTVSATGLSLTGADAANYTVNSSATTTASITARSLTVSAAGINKPYDGLATATVTLSDNRVAGDALVLAYAAAAFNNENVGTAKPVSVTGITVTGADAGNYTYNTTASTTADITPIVLTITATGIDKVYDGTTVASVTLADNRLAGDVFTVAYTAATFANKNVGTGKAVSVTGITVTGADAGNYTFSTTASTTASITTLAITGSITAQSRVYNANTNATILTRTLSGAVAGDDVSYTGGTASFNNKNVGTGKLVTATSLSLSGADAGNYTVNTTATAYADIAAYAIIGSITASNKVYDATTAATILTRTLADVFAGDVVSFTGGSATFSDKNVGTGKTVTGTSLSLSGADAGNYTVNSTATTTANITPLAITGNVTANNKVYDGNTTVTIATRTLTGVLGTDVVTYTGGSATFADKNVGNGKTVTATGLSLAGADAANYTVNMTATTTANITPRALLVSATGVNKIYDGNSTATVTLSDDRVAGDLFATSYTTATFNNENVGTAKPVSVSGIAIAGADAGNYTFNTTASTAADITPRSLTISATGINKVYDGNTSAAVTLSDDRVLNDVFTTSYVAATFANKNVGSGKAVSVTGISITGADAGNYSFNTTAATTADITPRALTVSAAGVNKVYDGNTTATVTLSDNRVAGDALTTNYAAASFADKNVGTGKPVSVTGINLGGADAGNYTFNPTASTSANITALAITGSITASNKVYDATTAATILTRTLAGVVSGDVVSYVGGTAAFANKNVGVAKTVTATGLSLSGADAANYTVNGTATTSADITALAITGSVTAANKVYDGNTTATILTRTLAGVISGDVVSYAGGTANFADKNVGNGKTVTATGLTLSGGDAGNYTVNSTATTTANITPRSLAVTATGVNKVYDATTVATVVLADNRVSGDVLSTSYGAAAFNDKNVGVGKPVNVSGIAISGADAGNYTVNTTTSTTANITPRAITGSFTAADKVYDGTTAATVVTKSMVTVLSGDVVTLNVTATFSDPNAGVKTVNGNLSLSGADALNYTVNATAQATATITPATATIVISDLVKPYINNTSQQPTVTVNVVSPAPAVPASAILKKYNSGNPDLWGTTLPSAVDVYGVQVTVTDPNYAVVPATALFVIYDPTGGFVTGGGWINSPAGASTQYPTAVGKANFGFNAQYKKGATVPTGQTEFQFQAGNLNFKSTDYEWLVVQGTTKAQFKGTGTINGSGSYTFILTALDGDNFGNKKPDSFRIKITGPGGTVYDNKMGLPDTSDEATVLGDNGQGGGSIVIHDPGKK